MTCAQAILTKRTSETKLYDVDVYADIPLDAVVTQVLSVSVDPLSDEALDEIGSYEVPIDLAPANQWVVNQDAITYRDGRTVPAGKIMQGVIGGGNDGYLYTIRIQYARSDDPGPHEATVQLKVSDKPASQA